MARIKLKFPVGNAKQIEIKVRISDINYGNHLGNDSLVTILHEARIQWLQTGGFTEKNIGDTGLILNELVVNYLNEGFYGDLFQINILPGEISNMGFEIYYRIDAIRNEQKINIGIAKTGMVCFDYEIRKPKLIPTEFASFLAAHY
jgi:acyl-CoA thioesterase FadM